MGMCCSRKKSQIETIEKIEPKECSRGWFDLPYDMRRMIIDLLDLKAKANFAKCSADCCEEVMLSRNYIDAIKIFYDFDSKYRNIVLSMYTKNEGRWLFAILPLTNGNVVVVWKYANCSSNKEIISIKTFDNKTSNDVILMYFDDFVMKNKKSLVNIEIYTNRFPYDKTNINGLSGTNLEQLILDEHFDGIDPIRCGFVDLDTICRFQDTVNIPNYYPLDYFFKIKSRNRYLANPLFTLEQFDDFLRRFLVEEELEGNVDGIKIGCKKIEKHGTILNDLKEVVRKYAETMYDMGTWMMFKRESKKSNDLYYAILLDKTHFRLFVNRREPRL